MKSWKEFSVSDFAEVVGGGTPKTKIAEYWNGDVPWLTPKDLSKHNSRYISKGERCISRAGLESSSAKIVPSGTVLLTTRAPVGYVAIASDELCTNQGFRSLIIKEGFDQEFIYYVLRHNTEYLRQHASGSTFQELPGSVLKSLRFMLPSDVKEQKRIAEILGSLDDKIELNRRMNQTLEAMARAVFVSWFVDFDPVIDNALAAGNPIPAELAEKAARRKHHKNKHPLPKDIKALFPDRFTDSPLGPIPKGWKVSTIGTEFDLIMGQSPPGESYNETGKGIVFYQGRRDFGFRYPEPRIYCSEPKRYAEKSDTLVSVRAPVGDVNMANERCCIGRGVAAARHKSGSRSYTYYMMRQQGEIFRSFDSEGTVFGSIGKTDFEKMKCLCPDFIIIKIYEEKIFFIDEQIEINEQESKTLTHLRDSLLPKLLSGEIEV